ncbi:4-(cytidine 5'-diphospho)-2-C-methyl-D-erythritol kinase [Ruminococcus sp.]|uniref:4-(cytidine 5'-diphospho)-2-C-methyl-D-erythritol kinase n=1 Tax=Ruminococcus sp. TaxID=41978 RepID=UPI0025CF7B04|nr:4-(cytidine 5'-diphospho)-2-C-methyl-D-erythritol kinase [Ruminococcus sp.]
MVTCNNLKIKAYGKLNLALDIVGRRDDGYHMLNTIMQSVSCYDLIDITLAEGEGIEIRCDLEFFPTGEDNIMTKAVHAFKAYTGIDYGCKIIFTVEKNLPSQAGMGGGSADCAAVLQGLNFIFDTKLTDEQLCEIGVKLGADVPFCIVGGTQLCQGVGEILSRLPSPDCWFVVVKPDVGISTPEAFKKYDSIVNPKRCNMDVMLRALGEKNLLRMCPNMFNVLEYAAECDEISKAEAELKSVGALSAMMTGSGSAIYGVFFDEQSAQTAFEKLSDWKYKCVCKPVKQGYEFVY